MPRDCVTRLCLVAQQLREEYILVTEMAGSEIIAEANKHVKAGASMDVLANAQKRLDNIRSDIANILSKARIPKDNIDKQDRENIKHLTTNEDILILPADKGKAAVVMDKGEYNSKLNKIVSDTKVYQKLKLDPTPAFKHNLRTILTRMKGKEKITQAQYYHIYPTSDLTPRLYGLPKIHSRALLSD